MKGQKIIAALVSTLLLAGCGQVSALPEIFYLMDAENGKCVYTGSLQEKGYHEDFSEYNGYGDFTDFRPPGNYYIEAPVLGRSCSFLIGDGVYNEVFREACRQYYYNR